MSFFTKNQSLWADTGWFVDIICWSKKSAMVQELNEKLQLKFLTLHTAFPCLCAYLVLTKTNKQAWKTKPILFPSLYFIKPFGKPIHFWNSEHLLFFQLVFVFEYITFSNLKFTSSSMAWVLSASNNTFAHSHTWHILLLFFYHFEEHLLLLWFYHLTNF